MHPFLVLREEEPPTVNGRTLVARIATYDRIYQVSPTLRERVRRGAFKAPMARPTGVLRYRHLGERPGDQDDLASVHGLLTALREDGDSVIAELEVFEGSDGDKILRLAKSGAIGGVSMAAVITDSARGRDGVNDVRRISAVNGVSLTPTPAYDDAKVLALRELESGRAARIEQARKELAAARALLSGLGSSL